MLDINDELDTIMQKHGPPEPPLLKKRIETAIRSGISEYVSKYGNRMILRGLKYSSKGEYPILDVISEYGNIIAVVDQAPFADEIRLNDGMIIKILDEEEAEKLNCDLYIVNSKNHGRKICYEVASSRKKYHTVDLYKELRVRYGIALMKSYNEYDTERDFSHNKTYEAYQMFQNNKDLSHLKLLLSACLSNRDFITFYETINEVSEMNADFDSVLDLKRDVDHLLDEVRLLMKKRYANSAKDIIVHWIDQVGFEELDHFPKLKQSFAGGYFSKMLIPSLHIQRQR